MQVELQILCRYGRLIRRRGIVALLGLNNAVRVFDVDIDLAVLSVLDGIAWHIAQGVEIRIPGDAFDLVVQVVACP